MKKQYPEIQKLLWNENDTFHTMHRKLLKMVGEKIMNKEDRNKPFTIFEVDAKIKREVLEYHFKSFIKYLHGDPTKRAQDSSYNFNNEEDDIILIWNFQVKVGFGHWCGRCEYWAYNFSIPRSKPANYKEDKNQIMYDPECPFIYYELGQ